jgi:hypothetical protein
MRSKERERLAFGSVLSTHPEERAMSRADQTAPQPGTPKPPGNPPPSPDPDVPKPMEEPPPAIPVPPIDVPPTPFQALR